MARDRLKRREISSDRVRKVRKTKNKIIIAVEGANKTEKNYFSNFNTGKESYTITFAKGNYTDPLNLVKSLYSEIQKLGLDLNGGDKAYCVFDVDDNPHKDKMVNEAKEYARIVGIEIITSTPCIELWFLNHFEYTTAYMSNDEVIKRLKTHYPKYKKNINIYPDICGKTDRAIKNSKKLEDYQKNNNKIIGNVEANPNTEMYKIVEYLIKNK